MKKLIEKVRTCAICEAALPLGCKPVLAASKPTLTATVKDFMAYLPEYFVLPHPSPRNNIWKKKNPWFETELLPLLAKLVNQIIYDDGLMV